jgi:hypothetical protein
MLSGIPSKPEDYALCARFYEAAQKLLPTGRSETHPAEVRTDRFQGILEGLQELKEGGVSGSKLVYQI